MTGWLNQNGITARAYYSDAQPSAGDPTDPTTYRQHLEGLLLNNQIKALVATTALGMGYDKPDLGFVVHYQAPGSIVAYYQQVGRAGRAIDHAVGVLMSGREDGEIQDYFRHSAFPDENHVNAILEALANSDGLSERRLEETVNLRQGQIEKVLKFLSVDNPSPVLKDGPKWLRTPVPYDMDHERIRRLTNQRAQEWQEVQEYIDTPDCLMVFLARSLDDESPRPCGKCSRCLGRPVIDEGFSHRLAVDASLYLRRSDLPLEGRKQVATGAFPQYGFKGNLPEGLRAETVKETAILSALENQGTAAGLLSDSLLRAATSAKYRRGLMGRNLALLSPFNPEAGFEAGNAMACNKYIYCLADAAVVVTTGRESGGTWKGAIENLKHEWVPLWVQEHLDPNSGNAALVQQGARWLPKSGLMINSLASSPP